MTALQLNAELFRVMGEVADDKDILRQIIDYVKKLAENKRKRAQEKEKQKTLEQIDHALAQVNLIKEGKIKCIPLEDVLNEL
jgi:NADH:ubiquinone oxidoreductase subunit D